MHSRGLILWGPFSAASDSTATYHLFLGLNNDRDGNLNIRYLHVFPKDYEAFYSCFCQVRDKYEEWSRTAAENSVKDFKKKIPVDFGEAVCKLSLLGRGGNYATEFIATFAVESDGQAKLLLGSADNEREFYVYSSPEQFSTLVSQVSIENIKAKYDAYLERKARRERAETDRNDLFK